MRTILKKQTPTTKVDMSPDGNIMNIIMPDIKLVIDGIDTEESAKAIRRTLDNGTNLEFKDFIKIIKADAKISLSTELELTNELNSRLYQFFMNFIQILDEKGYKSISSDMSHMKVTIKMNGRELIISRSDKHMFMVTFRKGVKEPLPKEIDIAPFTELLGVVTSIYTGLMHYKLYPELCESLKHSLAGYEHLLN